MVSVMAGSDDGELGVTAGTGDPVDVGDADDSPPNATKSKAIKINATAPPIANTMIFWERESFRCFGV